MLGIWKFMKFYHYTKNLARIPRYCGGKFDAIYTEATHVSVVCSRWGAEMPP